jgi:hemerythrin-like domain-containing protein
MESGRRTFLLASGVVGAGVLLGGCDNRDESNPFAAARERRPKEVTAAEDLMREHGVLRRALLVYAESASRLRRNPASVPAAALHETAMLFRRFGEDYHERTLEERLVFPALREAGGPAARYVDLLIAQHNRGREITDTILAASAQGRLAAVAGPLSEALGAFVWMYENHSAREDTIVYPAWKSALSGSQYDEMTDRFERLEREIFGEDGFRDAAERIGRIEEAFGMADPAHFTAPPPPKL